MLTEHIKLLGEQMGKTPLWIKTSINALGAHTGTVAVYHKISDVRLRLIYAHTVSIQDATVDESRQVFAPEFAYIIAGLREQHYFRKFEGVRDEVLTNVVESLELDDRGAGLGADEFGRIVYQGDVDFLYVTDDETGKEYEVSYDGSINEM